MFSHSNALGPNSNLRRKVVKKTERKTKEKKGRRYIEWAILLKRVFKIDVTKCVCSGEIKIISAILDVNAIVPILKNLKISTNVPEPFPARAPPEIQGLLW